MATYLVLRRINEDRVYLPSEVIVDPPNALRLLDWGYIAPIPADFSGVVSDPPPGAVESSAPSGDPTPPEAPEEPQPETKAARPVARVVRRRR